MAKTINKKKLIFILCAVIAVVAVILMVLFLVVFKNDESDESPKGYNFEGAWRVIAIEDDLDDSVTFVTGEYAIFKDSTVQFYRTGKKILQSSFSLGDNGFLSVTETNSGYFMQIKNNDYFKLWESETRCKTYMRYPNEDMSAVSYTADSVVGKWNVTFHDKVKDGISDEYWIFENGAVAQYANGNPEPVVTVEYTWKTDGAVYLVAKNNAISMQLNFINETEIALIDCSNGALIQLQKD